MHELLVPFVFCLEQDKLLFQRQSRNVGSSDSSSSSPAAVTNRHGKEPRNTSECEGLYLLRELMDASQVEADAYLLFASLMKQMKEVFETKPQRKRWTQQRTRCAIKEGRMNVASAVGKLEPKEIKGGLADSQSDVRGGTIQDCQQQQKQQRVLPAPFPPLPVPKEKKSPVLRLCDRIQNVSLRSVAPRIYFKLKEVSIAPQLYVSHPPTLFFFSPFVQ